MSHLTYDQAKEVSAMRLEVSKLTTQFFKNKFEEASQIITSLRSRTAIATNPRRQKARKKPNGKSVTNRVVQQANSSYSSAASDTHINQTVLANADSGATGTYLTVSDIKVLNNVQLSAITEQISVSVATGALIHSTHHGYLNIPGHGSIRAYVFPQLKGSLLSISQLVDLGLRVTYCKTMVKAIDKDDNIVIQGHRDTRSGLWMVDLKLLSIASDISGEASAAVRIDSFSSGSASAAIRLDSASDFVNYWHAAYGSPAASTFVEAIDNGYICVPGLSSAKVRRHLPNTIATAHGHLTATRKGVQSTKPNKQSKTISLPDTAIPDVPLSPEKRLWVKIDDVKSGRTHADATGPLPMRARSNALYQIIFYNEDTNYIHVETSTSRGGPELLAALQRAVKFFNDRHISIEIIRMDNECSKLTKDWIHKETMTLELTPVSHHRTNRAERAIRTWKDHFIAVLATTDPGCPLFFHRTIRVNTKQLASISSTSSPVRMGSPMWKVRCDGHTYCTTRNESDSTRHP